MTVDPYATHVDRGYGYEQIVRWEDNAVHVRPMFGGGTVRVPQAAIYRAACIETVTFEEWRTA